MLRMYSVMWSFTKRFSLTLNDYENLLTISETFIDAFTLPQLPRNNSAFSTGRLKQTFVLCIMLIAYKGIPNLHQQFSNYIT